MFLSLLLIQAAAFGQLSDTVYVNDVKNAYLIFDDPVDIINIGTHGDYAVEVEKNTVFLKALQQRVAPTNFFVMAGQKVVAGTIGYSKENTRSLYDFRERTLNAAATYSPQNYVPEVDVRLIKDRLYSLEQTKREIFDVGTSRDHISWTLMNLRADPTALYVRLRLENSSGLVYRVESISIENAEYYRKSLLSRKRSNRLPVVPLIQGNMGDVKAYSHHDFFLALPVYAVGKEGAVLITIRETTGIRSLQLEIPPALMLKVSQF